MQNVFVLRAVMLSVVFPRGILLKDIKLSVVMLVATLLIVTMPSGVLPEWSI
jgi:hypothetical protein